MALPNVQVAEKDGNFYLNLDHYHDDIIDFIKTIDGSEYQGEMFGEEGIWEVPANKDTVKKLTLLNVQVEVNESALKIWNNLSNKADRELEESQSYEDVDVSDYEPVYDHWDHQEKALKMSRVHDNLGLLFEMGPQPLDANVLTPEGFVEMGDIEVDDYVIGRDGEKTEVEATKMRGKKDVYEVTFNDGTSTQCSKDHKLSVMSLSSNRKWKNTNTPEKRFKKKTLGQIMDEGIQQDSGHYKHYLPINEPVEFNTGEELKINPYVLGVILGDGGITGGDVRVTSQDIEIIQKVKERTDKTITPTQYTSITYGLTNDKASNHGNVLIDKLRNLNLMGKKSKEKFIPEKYKKADIGDRIELLQGLCDTDGTASKEKDLRYASSSEKLIDDVTFLIRSLGGLATKNIKKTADKYNDSFRIYAKMPPDINPFKASRKRKTYNPGMKGRFKSIRDIEKVSKEQTKCISVAADDSLYLTDDFITISNSGKSKSAIDINFYRFQKDEISSCLILCPLSIKQVWFKELKEHAPERYDIIDLHCNNDKKLRETHFRKMKKYNKEDRIMTFGITTYDSAWRMVDKIKECNFESAIADESTDIKSHDAKRSKGAHEIAKSDGLDYRLILTGTPITNSAMDAWSQFEFLDPSIFPDSYYAFEQKYAIKGGWQDKVVVSYRNLDELKQKVHSISLRVTKDECLDLPDKVFTERYIQLSNEERDAYDKLKEQAILHLNEQDNVTVNNILAELAKLQQLANGFIHYEDIDYIEEEATRETERFGKSKLNELKSIIEETDEKIVVWAQYRKDIEYIEEMLEDNFDFDYVALHGGTSDKSGELEKQFHNDEDTKVFISQIQTGAKGIDLTPASVAVYYSNTFSLDNYLQSQDRLHRKGQENKVTYISLISEDTVDERIMASLEDNKKVAMEIMDDVKQDGEIDDI